MTESLYEQRLTLERRSYERVQSAWLWMSEHARNRYYSDEYLETIATTNKQQALMPIAEVLMCLVNTVEPRYQQMGIPAPTEELINNVVEDLLEAFERNGFAGHPYLQLMESEVQPNFTDSVCYLLGALIRVVENPAVRLRRNDDCRQVMNQAITWLLDARIEVPQEDKKPGAVWGWSWTSARDLTRLPQDYRRRFEDRVPPQTYFTSQVMISLCEALFDSQASGPRNREALFQAIMAAKQFLLATIVEVKGGDRGWYGWEDFLEEMAEATGAKGIKPYGKTKRQSRMRPDMALYPLEALSYLRYYMREVQYQGVRGELRAVVNLDEFDRFTPEEDGKLDGAFGFCLQLRRDKNENPFEYTTEIQVAEPLNLAGGKVGVLESGGTSKEESVYQDGTVPYNLLNALNFYVRYREQTPKNSADFQEWRDEELGLVRDILERCFVEKAFSHASSFEQQRKEAIYATRAAVAALLSWGVARPERVSRELVSPRVMDLIGELYREVAGPELGKGGEAARLAGVSNALAVGFHIGVFAAELRRMPEKDFMAAAQHFGLPTDQPFDKQAAVKTNGIALVRRLGNIVSSTEEEAKKELKKLEESRYLSPMYKEVLRRISETFVKASGTERVELLGQLLSAPWPSSTKHVKEDVCGV